MRSDRAFSAPSLSQALKQFRLYRSTGLLTIQRAAALKPEEAYIMIERGQPTSVLWNRQEHEATEALLAWFNSWGEIRFTFQSAEPLLQLPQAGQSSLHETSPIPDTWTPYQHQPPQTGSITRPLPAIDRFTPPQRTGALHPIRTIKDTQPEYSPVPAPQNGAAHPQNDAQPFPPPETTLPQLTAAGRGYPAVQIPRYDRIVFLLINGQRTASDLAQLTRRSPSEIYATLLRLQNQQLITIVSL